MNKVRILIDIVKTHDNYLENNVDAVKNLENFINDFEVTKCVCGLMFAIVFFCSNSQSVPQGVMNSLMAVERQCDRGVIESNLYGAIYGISIVSFWSKIVRVNYTTQRYE